MSRARHTYQPWSDEDIERLYRLYPRAGVRGTAKALGRTPQSIRWKRHELGVYVGDFTQRRLVSDVARDAGCMPDWVARCAQRDGVLKRHGRRADGAPLLRTVQLGWAEAFIARHRARTEAAELDGHWMAQREVAEAFSTEEAQVRACLLRDRGWLVEWIGGAQYRVAPAGRLLVFPGDVLAGLSAYREAQREWWTLPEVAEAWGVPVSAVKAGRWLDDAHLSPFLRDAPVRRFGPRREVHLPAAEVKARTEAVRAERAARGLPVSPAG